MAWSVLLALWLASPSAEPVPLPPPREPPRTEPTSPPPSRPPSAAAPKRVLRPTYVGPPPSHAVARSDRDAEAETLGLRRDGDGYRYDGSADERFDAVITRDGRVELIVDPSVVFEVEGVCLVAVCTRRKTERERARQHKATSTGLLVAALLAEAAMGRLTLGPGLFYGIARQAYSPLDLRKPDEMPGLSAVTVVGRYGHLPAPTVAMSAFLDRTFDLRLRMATDAAKDDLATANRRLSQRLVTLWTDPQLTDDQRRTEVLQTWQDLDADPDPAPALPGAHADAPLGEALVDPLAKARADATADARRRIISAVRRHAPEGSTAAFTRAQLDAFNAGRHGAARFDPYAEPPAATPAPSRPPATVRD